MPSHSDSVVLSDAISAIYDCVLDRASWPQALKAMASVLDSSFGLLIRAAPAIGTTHAMSQWGLSHERFYELQHEWGHRQNGLSYQVSAPLLTPFSLDHAAQALQIQDYWDQPFFTEWARPSGFGDSANMVLFRTEHRILTLVMVAKEHEPRITPEHLGRLGLLAPHLHRAVTLGDYFDRQNLAISSFERLLDSLNMAVVFMDERGRVRHANLAATHHIEAIDGLDLADGRLKVAGSETGTIRLRTMIHRVAQQSGASGLESLPLKLRSGEPAVAYVLPLNVTGGNRPSGHGSTVALVLCSAHDGRAPVHALASLYGLTDAESRVLMHISHGRNRAQTATELQVADSTVKSHLEHIFEKTGMTSQAELMKCFTLLAAPIRST